MKKLSLLTISCGLLTIMTSCGGKLGALSADNFTVTPNPLEAHAGQVPATITGNFPEKYMNKKAVVTVTPVLRWNGGEMAGAPATFQGEKVQGNNQTISYLVGGHYTMRANFAYQPAMQQSQLYLTFNAYVGNKQVQIPEVMVATGVIATSQLVNQCLKEATPSYGQDAFERSTMHKQTATIQFLLGQANLRASELNSDNIRQFIAKLKEIQANPEGNVINNIEVSAYASPDGKYEINEKLAGKREANSSDYVKQQLKKTQLDTFVDSKYTAEDWEGFQELVAESSLQDKDLILSVLSMYKDPEEREREIKNIATVYKDLADGILPQLRRARLTANYEVIGRDDDQILAQFNDDATKLSLEELVYAATLIDNPAQKEAIYAKTIQLYPKDARAYNNLGAMAYQNGNLDTAVNYFTQALSVNPQSAEANANMGLISLLNGKTDQAQQYLSKGSGADQLSTALGALYISQGQYAQAAQALRGCNSNTAALAQLLAKDYTSCTAALSGVKKPTALTSYLKALVSARSGYADGVTENLKAAIAQDPSFAEYAKKDLELSKYANR